MLLDRRLVLGSEGFFAFEQLIVYLRKLEAASVNEAFDPQQIIRSDVWQPCHLTLQVDYGTLQFKVLLLQCLSHLRVRCVSGSPLRLCKIWSKSNVASTLRPCTEEVGRTRSYPSCRGLPPLPGALGQSGGSRRGRRRRSRICDLESPLL